MSDLLTVYDDDQANTFIDCTVCDKKIRGDTQYKIHLTTSHHLKKENTLAAQGKIPRPPPLPEWTDIKQYLEYLNLDEPIIGLSSLEQIPDLAEDGRHSLQYMCKVCVVEMDLHNAVAHVVGRKHRQKYLELKRPDLVTWRDNFLKQPGLVARAKAAVVEKQEGWGTPVPLKTPQNKFRNVNQGNDLRSSVHGQDPRMKSPLVEDIHRKSNLDEDKCGWPYYTGEKNDQYDRPHPDENRHQRQFEKTEIRGRFFRGDNYSKRAETEVYGRPHVEQGGGRRPHSQEDYEEANLGRGQYSRGDRLESKDYDVQENVYQEDVPRNKFRDRDLRIHSAAPCPGESVYQEEKMEVGMYAAYEERGSGMEVMPKHGRSFHDEERRENVREFARRTWDESNEMQGYPERLDPRDFPRAYSHEPVPAKKKRKSRFSDATAEEIAVAHMRHSQEFIHKENLRGAQRRANSPLFNNPVVDSGSMSHDYQHTENVLDVLSDIQIENLEEAKFLKEKLCTVLKEFQANKTGGHTSQFASEQRRDAYDKDLRDDPDSIYLENRDFQEVRRYEDDPRSFQESRQHDNEPRAFGEVRRYEDDPSSFQESRQHDNDPRAFGEVRRNEDDPSSFQESRQHDNDPRAFGEVRRYEDDPMSFQESRQYDDDPRVFGEVGQYKDDPRGPRESRFYEDDSRDHRETRRFESYPSDFQEARQYADDPRKLQKTRLHDNKRDFPEQRVYEDDPREEAGRYKEYSRASQDSREGPRGTHETRYYDDDFRGFGNVDPERKWDHQRRHSLERFKGLGPEDIERGFQESIGKPPIHYQPPSLLEKTRIFPGRGQQRLHHYDRRPGDEFYDPFHPSSSPPPETTNSTSLDKIASTLLELVARR
ncbi:uncharacterized protein si:ch211-13c6.2 isoform X2 [Myxocyprinus asiaticus]|uniref:uncharacterized protein si:ch211-13c6.2 isoform X2 n=1 Tax=Myxocyprinus asiaticus TaxID=70543 RepID=UPI002222256E|nr:uncharacterized protein si:ch211-13c6.2 isoform X2 [Myxocyprinus asiaticus]